MSELAIETRGLTKTFGGVAAESLEIRKRVGYVSENQIMYDCMQVGEIIDFSRALYPRWNTGTVNKYLDIFELPRGKRVKQLSKGMRTQLALVLALGPEPDLLIMDEPTNGLDPIKRKEFLTTVLAEISLTGQTVFMSSHQLSEDAALGEQS